MNTYRMQAFEERRCDKAGIDLVQDLQAWCKSPARQKTPMSLTKSRPRLTRDRLVKWGPRSPAYKFAPVNSGICAEVFVCPHLITSPNEMQHRNQPAHEKSLINRWRYGERSATG